MIVININNISAKVLATPLTGLNTALTGVITSTDTVLQAFGKIQNQISNIPATVPGGLTRQVQFNNAGAFGGSPELTFFATNRLSLGYAAPVDAGFRLDVSGTVRFDNLLTQIGNAGDVRINSSSVAIGGFQTMAIGVPNNFAIVSARGSTAIGAGARATTFQTTAIGQSAVAAGFPSIAIGSGAYAPSNGDCVFGGGISPDLSNITNVYFGSGVQRGLGSPIAGAVKGDGVGISYAINGSGGKGTNFAGGNLTLAGGKATGNALNGDVIFSTANVGASGTTLATLANRWAIKGNTGHLQALGAFDILLDTTTGSKIGGSGALLALYNNTPIAQPTTLITPSVYLHVPSSAIHTDDTFDGYTIAQVVKALRDLGALT